MAKRRRKKYNRCSPLLLVPKAVAPSGRKANQFPTDPFRDRDRQGVMAGSDDPHVVMTDSHDP